MGAGKPRSGAGAGRAPSSQAIHTLPAACLCLSTFPPCSLPAGHGPPSSYALEGAASLAKLHAEAE